MYVQVCILCLCVCVCICMCVNAYVYVHVHVYIYIYIYICVCISVQICIHLLLENAIEKKGTMSQLQVRLVSVCGKKENGIHTYIHMYIYTRISIHTYTAGIWWSLAGVSSSKPGDLPITPSVIAII